MTQLIKVIVQRFGIAMMFISKYTQVETSAASSVFETDLVYNNSTIKFARTIEKVDVVMIRDPVFIPVYKMFYYNNAGSTNLEQDQVF